MFGSKVPLWHIVAGVSGLITTALAQDPIRPYPLADSYLSTTNFLNHSSYIQNLDDQQWYLDTIPFVDLPDQTIQDVYYYRASVIKRHLKFAHEGMCCQVHLNFQH